MNNHRCFLNQCYKSRAFNSPTWVTSAVIFRRLSNLTCVTTYELEGGEQVYKSLLLLNEECNFENIFLVVVNMNNDTKNGDKHENSHSFWHIR
ncbi:hypothetical protein YC2023_090729 [Brassica napus]